MGILHHKKEKLRILLQQSVYSIVKQSMADQRKIRETFSGGRSFVK